MFRVFLLLEQCIAKELKLDGIWAVKPLLDVSSLVVTSLVYCVDSTMDASLLTVTLTILCWLFAG